MKPLIVIPARGGSKGLHGKNIKKLNGKPLIHYTIESARKIFRDDQIYISTDDVEIKKVAERTGLQIPELRPAHLATDHASSEDVLLYCLERSIVNGYEPDTIILLQVTSPFRNEHHIQEAINIYDYECDMVVSVKNTKANPYYRFMVEDEYGWLKKTITGQFDTRQDCPDVYEFNGAIYLIRVESLMQQPMSQFKKVRKYIMKREYSVDIDNQFDWDIAEMILEKRYLQ